MSPRPTKHRSLSDNEEQRLRRVVFRHAGSGPEGIKAAEAIIDWVQTFVQEKYDKGYHSGYTAGQKNSLRSSG